MCWLHLFSPGSPYYDNVRPLCYSDSDAVLLCFDISRPDTVDGSLKKVFILLTVTTRAVLVRELSLCTVPIPRQRDLATSQLALLVLLNITYWKSTPFSAQKANTGNCALLRLATLVVEQPRRIDWTWIVGSHSVVASTQATFIGAFVKLSSKAELTAEVWKQCVDV